MKNKKRKSPISAKKMIKALEKKISKYIKNNPSTGIITCDIGDVYSWIDEIKKKHSV